jgi:hypothetical protein
MKCIKEFDGNIPSLFDKNWYDDTPPEDMPNPPRDPKKTPDRKDAATEKAWAKEGDIAAGFRAHSPGYDQVDERVETGFTGGATQVGDQHVGHLSWLALSRTQLTPAPRLRAGQLGRQLGWAGQAGIELS